VSHLRTIVTGVLLAATVALGGLVTPSAAHADTGTCLYGDFCMYTGLNRTPSNAACRNTGDAQTMGQCADLEESAWNNGAPCSGCDTIAMYYYTGFMGAWHPAARGAIVNDLRAIKFVSAGGSDATHSATAGMGQTLWHNVESARWY
jgi:hypothetical protein